jgi:hypothetical protein
MPALRTDRSAGRPRVARAPWAKALLLGVAIGLPVAPGDGVAQEPDAPTTAEAPGDKSPLVAALLQAALPPLPLGYVYAENVVRGLIPTGMMVAGASLFIVQTVDLIDWTGEGGSEELMWVGLAVLVGGYAFGIVDAAAQTRVRNARVSGREVGFQILPAPSGAGVAVGVVLR